MIISKTLICFVLELKLNLIHLVECSEKENKNGRLIIIIINGISNAHNHRNVPCSMRYINYYNFKA